MVTLFNIFLVVSGIIIGFFIGKEVGWRGCVHILYSPLSKDYCTLLEKHIALKGSKKDKKDKDKTSSKK